MQKVKICTKCKKELPITQFSTDNQNQDKLFYWCKKCVKEYNKKYAIKNKNKISAFAKKYYQEHKEIIERQQIKYRKNRRKTDINYRILKNMRCRLNKVLKGNPKLSTTMKLVGCSIEELKVHLASKFTKGMTWKNYGKWEIDHIKPCAKFDLSKPEEQLKCFHYTNLQPLWEKDNQEKRSKWIN
jgi:hypothetical protein